MKKLSLAIGATLIAATPVLAQEPGHEHPAQAPQTQTQKSASMPGGMMMRGNMQSMQMGAMVGQQMIPVTVTAINAKTGLVDVTDGSQALKLPFPPAALAQVKVGDKLTVHIGVHKR